MSSRSIDVNRNTESNMSRIRKVMAVLTIIGCVITPFGSALKCYVCTPTSEQTCMSVKDEMITECPAVTTPKPTNEATSTTGSSSTGSSNTGSSSTGSSSTGSSSTGSSSTGTTTDGTTTDSTTTDSTTTDGTTTDGTTTDGTTTDGTTTDGTTTDETTTDGTTTDGTTTDETTTDGTTTDETTTDETTTDETTTDEGTTDETTTVKVDPPSYSRNKGYLVRSMSRRSLIINRPPPVNPLADETKVHCFTATGKEPNTVVRGCSTDPNACTAGENCKTCDTDKCNSATSNIVFTSMIMSLVIALIIVK